MAAFEQVVELLLAGALLAAWSRRVGAPYPALLSLAGAVAAVVLRCCSRAGWRTHFS
jgi:CPA1 family monovalent cation:H+ antiporter